MKLQTETQIETQKEGLKVTMPIQKAVEFPLLRDDIRGALAEFYEWYNWRYAMPVEVELDEDYVAIYVSYDITHELEACEKACIEDAKKEELGEEYTEEDIAGGCFVACHEDVITDTNEVFSNVWIKLWQILEKRKFRYDWEMSWEHYVKYLRVLIKF